MKRYPYLLLLMLIPFLTYSQVEVTLGTPYTVIDAGAKHYFYKDGEILTIKIVDNKEFHLQKLDAQKLSFIKIKVFKDFPKGFVIESVTEFNDRFYVFYSLWDKENQKEQLFYREIDFAQGTFMGEGKLLIKVDGKITGNYSVSGFYKYSVTDKFNFQFSNGKSTMLIKYRLKPEIRSDELSYDIIGMHVFTKDLETVSKKEVKMPYTEKKMNNIDYSVDSQGNAYILTTVYDDNSTDRKTKDGKANYHMELLTIKANTNAVVITPLAVNDKFINEIFLFENSSENMVCAGFYTNVKDKLNANANGVFLFKVGKDGKVFDITSYEIPVEVLNQYVSKRTQKQNEKKEDKDKADFENLELRQLIIEKDGSILLVGEQDYVITRTYTSNGRTTTTYTYYFNDILVTKIDPSGKLAWMKKLPKRQYGKGGRGGMSYKYMNGGDNHYFLFLDNEKNMNMPLDEVPAYHVDGQGGFLTAYKVNSANGNVTKMSLLNLRDVKGMEVFQFFTGRIFPLSKELEPANEFVLEVYKKKKEDILIKVNLGK